MKTLFVFIILVSLCNASLAKIKNADGETSTDPWTDFRNGDARLKCNLPCSFKDGQLAKKFIKANKEENWDDLVNLVIKSGFRENVNYFYLGLAAENTGLLEAALTYYRLALTESARCSSFLGTCNGIKVRAESKLKIANVKERLASNEDNLDPAENEPSKTDLPITSHTDKSSEIETLNEGENKLEPSVLKFEGKGAWGIKIKTDPITDEQIVTATLKSNEYNESRGGLTALLLRCDSQKVDIFVAFDDYLGSDSISVISRVDKEKPDQRLWSLSTNNQAAFYPKNEKKLLRRLFSAERFVVRATPYNENPKTLIFDVKGIYNALEPHNQVCGW